MLIDRDSYCDAATFLREEAEAWAPFEALLHVPDEILECPGDEDGPLAGSSGRALMVEMAQDQENLVQIAKELKDSSSSRTLGRLVFIWTETGEDAMQRETHVRWRDVPLPEVRRRFLDSEMELRRALAQVPDEHWVLDVFHQGLFWMDTIKACKFRRPQLDAVLDAAERSRAGR